METLVSELPWFWFAWSTQSSSWRWEETKLYHNICFILIFLAIKLGKSVSPTTIDPSRLIKPVNRISPNSDSISGSPIASQQVISGTPTTSIKAISPSSLPKLKEPRPTEVISGQPQSSTSEVTENGTRRFRCDICDIGFRFQVRFSTVVRWDPWISKESCKLLPTFQLLTFIKTEIKGHLDRHLRSTTHMSMEEAVRRTGRRPNAEWTLKNIRRPFEKIGPAFFRGQNKSVNGNCVTVRHRMSAKLR